MNGCFIQQLLRQNLSWWVLLKNVQGISKIVPCLKKWHVFIWQLPEILNVFNTLILKQILQKTKTFLKAGLPI